MKKTFLLSMALLLIGINLFAQWTVLSSGTTSNLTSVCFPDANTGYAVGDDGTILKTIDAGNFWNTVKSMNFVKLNSVYFTDATTGYVVGTDSRVSTRQGIILKTTNGGTNWTSLPLPNRVNWELNSVYFTDANHGYAVGGVPGFILKTVNGGANWTTFDLDGAPGALPNVYRPYSVYFPDASTGYVVGDAGATWGGSLSKTTDAGITWTNILVMEMATTDCRSVYFTDNSTGYAVGNGGIIKTIDGGTKWTEVSSGTQEELISVYFLPQDGSNIGYVVGSRGTILKTVDAGKTWTIQTICKPDNLSSVCFTDALTGYIVGANGLILKTINGGEPVLPTVSTTVPSSIIATAAFSGGNISCESGALITAKGVCFDLSEYPDITVSHTNDGSGSGSFNSIIAGLKLGTTYHVRAYATNRVGTSYGDDIAFTTSCPASYSIPFYEGFGTTDIPACWTQADHQGNAQKWQFGSPSGFDTDPALTWNYAYLNSNYYGNGHVQNADLITPLLDLSGYSTVRLGFNHFFKSSSGSSGTVSYSIDNGYSWIPIQTFTETTANPATFSMLIAAVARQSEVKFKWNYTGSYGYCWAIDDIEVKGANLTTTAITYIKAASALTGGTISNNGGVPVKARGVCWGTLADPTIAGSHTLDGLGNGTFKSDLTALTPNTTYHVRAYATNSEGTWYGNDIPFTTPCVIGSLPLYEEFKTTSIPECWTQTDHQGNGLMWQFGVINGYTPAPALTGNYAFLNSEAFGTGNTQNVDFVSPLFDVSGYSSVYLGFKHYFRSSPGSSGTLSYSIDKTNWITIQSFTETTANPAIFTQIIPALAGQTQVWFKWNYTGTWGWYWAIDDIKVTGVAASIILTTTPPSSLTTTKAVSGGNITSDGGGTITARGVCWGDGMDPDVSGKHTSDSSGTGSFISSITGLDANRNYHVRAYASNSAGVYYGNDILFSTPRFNPAIISTKAPTSITTTTVTSGGNITFDGGSPITARGVCWSVGMNPDITNNHASDSSGSGSFMSYITGLSPGTAYNLRAYATNSNGTWYGNNILFTTELLVDSTLTTRAPSSITATTAVSGGTLNSGGGAPVIVRGVCWSIWMDPDITGSHTSEGPGSGSFISNITGLDANTNYHVRAYATSNNGTWYGNDILFTTVITSQQISIPPGWSGISSYIQPADSNIETILNPLTSKLDIAYNLTGLYVPGIPLNTIGNLDIYSGYIIRLTDVAGLQVWGRETINKKVNLNPGWNLLPVLSQQNFNIENLFNGVTGFDIAKDVAGSGLYWKAYGINTIGYVEPGKAYYIKMNTAGSIDYSLTGKKASLGKAVEIYSFSTPWNNVVNTPGSHLVAFNTSNSVFQSGDIVGGFTKENWCAGAVEVIDPSAPFALTLNSDDVYSSNKDGFEYEEILTYRLYRPSTGETNELDVTYNLIMNTGYFENNGLSEVTSVKMVVTGISNQADNELKIYPNPAKEQFTIESVSKIKALEIMNYTGQTVFTNIAIDSKTTQVNVSNFATGVYFVRIRTDSGIRARKILVTK